MGGNQAVWQSRRWRDNQGCLVMCVVSLPTFDPSPLRDAWGLHPPSRVGTRNRPALLRTRRAGTRAPVALLRAVVTPRP